MYYEMMDK